MKIAYTGWTWLINHKDNYKFEFEQFLKEVSYLGYDAVENFAFITDYFDNNADEVKGLLDKYKLEMANLYLHYRGNPDEDYKKAVEYADFMVKIGATTMNLQGVCWQDQPLDRPTDVATIKQYAELANRIGELCIPKGITPCFHPHANSPVYTEEQIDLLMEYTDPKLVALCIDTAHTTLAGMDPVAAVKKYLPRIGYMHLKDVDPDASVSPEWPMARFLPLGWGTVDFKQVVKVLKEGGYDGVLCVELDRQPICNYHSAMVSREYIKNVLGM